MTIQDIKRITILTQLYNFTSLATLFKYSPMRKDWTFEIKLKWPYLCISCNFPWYTYFNFYQLCRKLRYFTKLKDINDKNFYVLKIHLNFFEISNQVLKRENLIQIWKIFVSSWTPQSVPCVWIKPYHMINLNFCIWHHSAESIFEVDFQRGWFFFSDLDLIFKFLNWNGGFK